MIRMILTALVTLVVASAARAQDMPLSQILIDGEGWKKVEEKKPMAQAGIAYTAGTGHGWRWNTRPGDKAVYFGYPGDSASNKRYSIPLAEPAGLTFSPDGGTLFVADAGGTYVWAFRMSNYEPVSGAPYCPLRLARGKKTSEATGLTTDRDGRIYAATPLGIQVFDPTGRLCGVMHAPDAGKLEFLAFEEDRLRVWVGDVKYARKLNTGEEK
jgi:sugar lactone lactonase YvrE